ncbi:MAG TPA: energy transducer TonB [Pyrinomonadaceae bacterium]|jgi:TonB family protein
MCCKNFWSKIVSFALAFALGLLISNVFRNEIPANKNQTVVKLLNPPKRDMNFANAIEGGNGDAVDSVNNFGEGKKSGAVTQLKILSKPRALYTDEARANNVQGTVSLKVTFTAAGTIGSISTVSSLPDGLTEQAIAAARQIKFEPAKINGASYSVTKTVAYSFTIY